MKKEVNKILATIGFVLIVLGCVICGLDDAMALVIAEVVFSAATIAAVLALAFINAESKTLKNVGYSLSALCGVYGITLVANANEQTGLIVMGVGMLLFLVAALFYFIVVALKFFGFVKGSEAQVSSNVSDVLLRYKQMEAEKVITEEEFNDLKKKTFETTGEKISTLDDLRKWKKLLDQKVITEEEFSSMKANMFKK